MHILSVTEIPKGPIDRKSRYIVMVLGMVDEVTSGQKSILVGLLSKTCPGTWLWARFAFENV
jgi:hypothetical protein